MLAMDEYLSIIFLATTHSNAHFNFDDYSSKNARFLTSITLMTANKIFR